MQRRSVVISMKIFNVPIDELEDGDVYAVKGMEPGSCKVTSERGRVHAHGYNPFDKDSSYLDTYGYSGSAFRLM